MMLLYLDTSHLQKWQNRTLDDPSLIILDNFLKLEQNKLVISISHILDIIDRGDHKKAIILARFIDGLPKKWLANPKKIKLIEFNSAISAYVNEKECLKKPFVKHYIDMLECSPDIALSLPLKYRGSTLETFISDIYKDSGIIKPVFLNEANMKSWSQKSSEILTVHNNSKVGRQLAKENYKRIIKEEIALQLLSEKIEKAVLKKVSNLRSEKMITISDFEEEFVNWIYERPEYIPSLYITYQVQKSMHRNKSRSFKKSDFEDIYHLSALPYVDYFSADRGMLSAIKQTLKFCNNFVVIGQRLLTNFNKMNNRVRPDIHDNW